MKHLGLSFDRKLFYVRCICNIMNLIAQDEMSLAKYQIREIRHVIIYISLFLSRLRAYHHMCKQIGLR